MTESSRASSTSIQIFLKTDIFFSPFSKKKTNKPTNSRPHKNVKQRNIIASLTEHALYDVWHHCIRKPLFSSVHTNDKPAIQKKAPLWGTFSKTWVSDAWKPCSRVDKMLKRRKKSPFSYIFGYVSTGPKFLTKYLILLCGFIIKRGGGTWAQWPAKKFFRFFSFVSFERRQGHSQTSRGGNPEIGQHVRC